MWLLTLEATLLAGMSHGTLHVTSRVLIGINDEVSLHHH